MIIANQKGVNMISFITVLVVLGLLVYYVVRLALSLFIRGGASGLYVANESVPRVKHQGRHFLS
jgi:hypothetical protein